MRPYIYEFIILDAELMYLNISQLYGLNMI